MRLLTEELLIEMNRMAIIKHSPEEIVGVREPGALKMLVNAPRNRCMGKNCIQQFLIKQRF